MYFTRKLSEMSPTYKNLLIVHLLEKLKNLASEILHSQCKQQITQIEKIVNQSGEYCHLFKYISIVLYACLLFFS